MTAAAAAACRQGVPDAGIAPVVLASKEGLALINGTDGMLGMLAARLRTTCALLATTADIAAAMSVEALLGTDRVFADDLQALRPHPGQAASAANMRALLAGSRDRRSRTAGRRHPRAGRLLAAMRAAGRRRGPRHARPRGAVAARELAAAIDNPVVLPDGRVESQRQLPRRAGRLRARLPRDRRRRPRVDVASGAPTGCSTRTARTGCRRSSPTTPESTPGHMIAQYTQAAL